MSATSTTTTAPVITTLSEEEEKMRNLLAKKEQELLMLQRKTIEMELKQTRRQLEVHEKCSKKVSFLSSFSQDPLWCQCLPFSTISIEYFLLYLTFLKDNCFICLVRSLILYYIINTKYLIISHSLSISCKFHAFTKVKITIN